MKLKNFIVMAALGLGVLEMKAEGRISGNNFEALSASIYNEIATNTPKSQVLYNIASSINDHDRSFTNNDDKLTLSMACLDAAKNQVANIIEGAGIKNFNSLIRVINDKDTADSDKFTAISDLAQQVYDKMTNKIGANITQTQCGNAILLNLLSILQCFEQGVWSFSLSGASINYSEYSYKNQGTDLKDEIDASIVMLNKRSTRVTYNYSAPSYRRIAITNSNSINLYNSNLNNIAATISQNGWNNNQQLYNIARQVHNNINSRNYSNDYLMSVGVFELASKSLGGSLFDPKENDNGKADGGGTLSSLSGIVEALKGINNGSSKPGLALMLQDINENMIKLYNNSYYRCQCNAVALSIWCILKCIDNDKTRDYYLNKTFNLTGYLGNCSGINYPSQLKNDIDSLVEKILKINRKLFIDIANLN